MAPSLAEAIKYGLLAAQAPKNLRGHACTPLKQSEPKVASVDLAVSGFASGNLDRPLETLSDATRARPWLKPSRWRQL